MSRLTRQVTFLPTESGHERRLGTSGQLLSQTQRLTYPFPGWGRGRGLPVGVPTKLFFSKKYGGRGASGRRGDRPTTCTVPEASQERVRYASAPGCPGRRRASLALTDLHTHTRQRRSAGTLQVHSTLPVRRATATSKERGTYGGYINGPVCVVGSTLAVP